MLSQCKRDTDGDGDCSQCTRCGGCPLGMFRRCEIDAAILSASQIEEFKRDAQWFEYTEFLGTIRGYRHRDGRVLITENSLAK